MKLGKMHKHLAFEIASGETPETTLEGWPEEIAVAMRKQIAVYKRESKNEIVTLKGRLLKGTEKAVKFAILEGPTVWVPRSIATVLERAVGPCDCVEIPGWFAKKNELV